MTLTDTATDAKGLTSDEAARLLAERGPNEAATEQDGLLQRIVRHFWAPVPWMLEIAVIIQIAMREYVAASLIAAVLVFNVLLGTFQESRAKAALELLKQSLPLKARVRRDGNWTDLLARVLVQGDIVQLSLGTVVPADIKIVSGSILVDQSMLTGESVPIEAVAGTVTYAGAQVRRGEAIGLVTATGASTYFGRAAELVRVAHFESSEEKAVFGLVRNLTFLNAAILIWLVTYALVLRLPPSQIVLLVLTALISAVPVALPATFTLAAALGSRVLAAKGVLLTRLTALNEAATIDVLCADKTGTLTSNELGVALVRPLAEGWSEGDILAFAALASSSDGRDSVDMAIQRAAQAARPARPIPRVVSFTPFDPTTKQAEAKAVDASAREILITKGAPEKLGSSTEMSTAELFKLATAGYRTLAVTVGPAGQALLVGFVALSDSPRPDSAALLKELGSLGVHTVMLTGDTMATAMTVARAIGLEDSRSRRSGRLCCLCRHFSRGQVPSGAGLPKRRARRRHVRGRSERCTGSPSSTDGNRGLQRDRRRQSSSRYGAHDARARRHRLCNQGRTHRFPARPYLHVHDSHQQDRNVARARRRPPADGARGFNADAASDFNVCERFRQHGTHDGQRIAFTAS
jgi:H+-transporting ATPase